MQQRTVWNWWVLKATLDLTVKKWDCFYLYFILSFFFFWNSYRFFKSSKLTKIQGNIFSPMYTEFWFCGILIGIAVALVFRVSAKLDCCTARECCFNVASCWRSAIWWSSLRWSYGIGGSWCVAKSCCAWHWRVSPKPPCETHPTAIEKLKKALDSMR